MISLKDQAPIKNLLGFCRWRKHCWSIKFDRFEQLLSDPGRAELNWLPQTRDTVRKKFDQEEQQVSGDVVSRRSFLL
jgi:hypothetical protein